VGQFGTPRASATRLQACCTGADSGHVADDTTSETPPFDVQIASQLVGRRVLIGLTYVEAGQDDRHDQKHGVVEYVSEGGVTIRLSDGGTYSLPPDLRPWQSAPPGEYRLRSTGEVVIDPDFIANWRVTPGKSD
jgi:hypothetical protein